MPQPIIHDNFEKQAEQGQTAVGTKPAAPKVMPKPTGLDWLEQGFGQRRMGDDMAKKAKEVQEEKNQKEQLTRLKELDQRRSRQMYEEIQQAIMVIRKKKKLEQVRRKRCTFYR